MLWLIAIAVNLVTTGMFYDLAVRDLEIAVGAFALLQLTIVPEEYVLTARAGDVSTNLQLSRTQ
jgi:hypothetical protein